MSYWRWTDDQAQRVVRSNKGGTSLRNKVTKLHDEFDLEVFNVQVGRMQNLYNILSEDPCAWKPIDVLTPDHTGSVCSDSNIRTLDTSCARCTMLMAIKNGQFPHGTSFKIVFNET